MNSIRAHSVRPLPRGVPIAIVSVLVAVLAVWVVLGVVRNPGFAFLAPRGGAQWIQVPADTSLLAIMRGPTESMFARQFRLDAPLYNSELYVAAFRSARVYLDSQLLLDESSLVEAWKFERRVSVPGTLTAGNHTLLVNCVNDTGPPMMRLRWPEAGIVSGPGWFSVDAQGRRSPAKSAAELAPPAIAHEFLTVGESFLSLLPLVLIVFALGATATWALSARPGVASGIKRALAPSSLRWFLLAFLLLLGVNNTMRLGKWVGMDSYYHYEYIHYVAEHYAIPPITQGVQYFQAPLFYAIAAMVHVILRFFMEDATADRWLRLVPVFCSLGIVEIGFRFSRRVFPESVSAQRLTLVLAAFSPMLLKMMSSISNEPLAGLLGAAAAFAVLDVLMQPPAAAHPWRFVLAGTLWGFAALAKVSAIILGAPFVLGFAWWIHAWPGGLRKKGLRMLLFFASSILVCGWYFVRTQFLYGQPIVGGWNPRTGMEWWQFPGYRTFEQYTSFGVVLRYPVFCFVHGFWDGLYAGAWFDVEMSGVTSRSFWPTWNLPFAFTALPWALLPTLALALGCARALWPRKDPLADPAGPPASFARVFALLVAGTYGAAIFGHSLVLPYYSTIKATYALAAVPSLAVLVVIGVEPLLRRRWGRILVHAWLAVWMFLVGVGYWALAPG